jgi:hypothetical protein
MDVDWKTNLQLPIKHSSKTKDSTWNVILDAGQ